MSIREEDLDCCGLKILQDSELYCFTSDSVILANYVKANSKDVVVDLCSGSGIIAILLTAKTKAKKIIAVELQDNMAHLAQENIKLNNLEDKVEIKNISLQQAPKILGKESCTVVVCNPPYTKNPCYVNESETIAIARHELKMTLEELIKSVSELLKFGGKFYFVHRAERLTEILSLLNKYKVPAKELSFIYPKHNNVAYLVMIQASKGGKSELKVLHPIYN